MKKCGESLDGEHTMALNKYWCSHHFVCHDCSRPLGGSFSEENGNPFCSDCLSNKYVFLIFSLFIIIIIFFNFFF